MMWSDFPCVESDWLTRDRDGYGQRTRNGKTERAHRKALEEKLGRALLPGMHALHHCDNPPCVQQEHLYEGTQADNNRDMRSRGRLRIRGLVPLSDEQRADIRRRWPAETQKQLATEFGVTRSAIGYVVRSGR